MVWRKTLKMNKFIMYDNCDVYLWRLNAFDESVWYLFSLQQVQDHQRSSTHWTSTVMNRTGTASPHTQRVSVWVKISLWKPKLMQVSKYCYTYRLCCDSGACPNCGTPAFYNAAQKFHGHIYVTNKIESYEYCRARHKFYLIWYYNQSHGSRIIWKMFVAGKVV